MNFNVFLKSIVKIKDLELLGEIAHAKMSPPYRLELAEKMREKAKSAKKAAVLILFYPSKTHETQIVFILRKTYKGVHSAQVGFPGGKYEDDDIDLKITAIRETEEEIGVPTDKVEVLKPLSSLYIPPSNFLVHPYLGISKEPLEFLKQDDEVEDIIEIKLSDFLDSANSIHTTVPTSYKINVNVPAYKLNNYIIWGATAMMLSEVKDLLKQIL